MAYLVSYLDCCPPKSTAVYDLTQTTASSQQCVDAEMTDVKDGFEKEDTFCIETTCKYI